MTQNNADSGPLWFALTLLLCLLLAALCAWFFGSALKATYPQGILVFAEASGEEPRASDAFYIGMAIGVFFCGLIYSALTVSLFLLNRFRSTPLQPLQPLVPALLFSSVCCLALCVLCVVLAQ